MTDKKIVNEILDDLTNVKENLLTLSDDIWNNIDHNDTEKLEEGVQFKKSFNNIFQNFNSVSEQLAVLVRQFIGLKEESVEQSKNDSENRRIIAELNKEIPHAITESFTYKRPFAFTLCGTAFTNTTTWKDIYVSFLKYMYKFDSNIFTSFLNIEDFVSSKMNKDFSKDKKELRIAILIDGGIYAEVNHSAMHIARNIRKILKMYNLSDDQIQIYLRQDRNA